MRIAVLQQKGGSGKTTLAANLAAAAHLEGLRTILIDMDRQGSAIDWAGARPEGSQLQGLVVVGHDRPLSLPRFGEITQGFDCVIIDGPPRLDDVTRSAAAAADVALLPVRPGPFDFWAVSETIASLDTADEIRAELGRKPIRRVFVLNGAAVGSRLARDGQLELRAGGVVAGVVHQRVVFADAALRGESVLTTPGALLAASEIQRLWRAVKAQANGTEDDKPARPAGRKRSRAGKKAGSGKAQ